MIDGNVVLPICGSKMLRPSLKNIIIRRGLVRKIDKVMIWLRTLPIAVRQIEAGIRNGDIAVENWRTGLHRMAH